MSNLLILPRLLVLPRQRQVRPSAPLASAINTQNVVSIFSRRDLHHPALGAENVVRWEEDADGGNALFSANWASMLGPEAVRQYRLGWHRLIHPDDRFEAVMARLNGLLQHCPFNFTCRYWVFGDYHPVWFSGAPLRYERGRAVRWGGFWMLIAASAKKGGAA